MSRLPELEQDLGATAARLSRAARRFGRRARTLVPAAALACLVAAAVVAVGLFEANDDGVVGGGSPAATDAGFGTDATLEDMFGVFRQPQTAADDMGFTKDEMDEVPDRQPGEDFTQSRRVEWPGARIFLWPMRDGVCYGVPGGSGCVPLNALRRAGVSIGTGYGPGRRSIYGVVVDGVREVTLTANGGPQIHVPVRENFFFVDLRDSRVDQVRWRFAGRDHHFDVGGSLPDEPARKGGFEPIPGTLSDPFRFTVGGVAYSAVGYLAANGTVCVRVFDGRIKPTRGCEGTRSLRRRLGEQPAHLFAAGGTPNRNMLGYLGFARADVIDVEALEGPGDTTVILSKPWRAVSLDGARIRFLLVYARASGEIRPRTVKWPHLRVTLADGRTVLTR